MIEVTIVAPGDETEDGLATGSVNRLKRERDEARAEADALREELATLREEADDDARGAATVEDLYTTCINLLRDAGDRFGFLRGTATGMLKDLIAKHEAALSDVSKLEDSRAMLAAANAALSKERDANGEACRDLGCQLDAERAEVERLKAEYERQVAQMREAHDDFVAAVKADVSRLEAERDEARAALLAERQEMGKVASTLHDHGVRLGTDIADAGEHALNARSEREDWLQDRLEHAQGSMLANRKACDRLIGIVERLTSALARRTVEPSRQTSPGTESWAEPGHQGESLTTPAETDASVRTEASA